MNLLIQPFRIAFTIAIIILQIYDAKSQIHKDKAMKKHTSMFLFGRYGCGNLSMSNLTSNGEFSNSATLTIEKCYLHRLGVVNATVNVDKGNFETIGIVQVSNSLRDYFNIHTNTSKLPKESFVDSLKIGLHDTVFLKTGNYYTNDSIIFYYGNLKIGILAK